MLSKTIATTSVLLLSLQSITALPTNTIGAPKGVIVVNNHEKRDPIVIGSNPISIKPPHLKRDAEADADAEAEAAPGGSAWGGR